MQASVHAPWQKVCANRELRKLLRDGGTAERYQTRDRTRRKMSPCDCHGTRLPPWLRIDSRKFSSPKKPKN
jgi:hypothetical protein